MVRHIAEYHRATDGFALYCQQWLPAETRAVVLCAHGVGEHLGRYEHVARRLAKRGFLVAGYDHRGHGRSDGPRGHVARWEEYRGDLDGVAQSLRRAHPTPPLFLFGHSMGALVVLEYLLQQPREVRGAIVSAPPLGPPSAVRPHMVLLARCFSRVWPRLAASLPVDPGALSRDAKVVDAYRADPLVHRRVTVRWGTEILAAQARVRTRAAEIRAPLLVAHGEADRIASAAGVAAFFAALGSHDKELRIYPGAFHELHNDVNREEVLRDYEQWLERH